MNHRDEIVLLTTVGNEQNSKDISVRTRTYVSPGTKLQQLDSAAPTAVIFAEYLPNRHVGPRHPILISSLRLRLRAVDHGDW